MIPGQLKTKAVLITIKYKVDEQGTERAIKLWMKTYLAPQHTIALQLRKCWQICDLI